MNCSKPEMPCQCTYLRDAIIRSLEPAHLCDAAYRRAGAQAGGGTEQCVAQHRHRGAGKRGRLTQAARPQRSLQAVQLQHGHVQHTWHV